MLSGYKAPSPEQARAQIQYQTAQAALPSVIVACKINDDIRPDDFAARVIELSFEIGARMVQQAEALGLFED